MILDTHLNNTLEKLLDHRPATMTAEQLIHCIDLTLLNEEASTDALMQLNKDACHNQVAAVCVYPQHLPFFTQQKIVEIATVINFPEGNEDINLSLNALEQAAATGVNEIDYVLPYKLYLDGEKKEALKRCQAIIELCQKHQLTSKIILETGAFPEMHHLVYEISRNLAETGCDFIKTSTGKIAQGASLSAVFVMLNALKDSGTNCGIKVSGGVKTASQAFNYAQLAESILEKDINKTWFRIGASSLLQELTLSF